MAGRGVTPGHTQIETFRRVSREPHSDAAKAETFFELLETDLRLLSAESKKLDGFAHHITGLFNSKDVPNIKESCERALHKLRTLASMDRRTMEAIRQSPVSDT